LAVPIAVALFLVLARALLAKDAAPTDGTGPPPADQAAPAPITLVVFDFKVQEGMSAGTGKRIADALSSRLAEEKDFRVVLRTEIKAGLEKEGLEPPAPGERVLSIEAGHLLGAELAVFGRAFAYGGSSYLIAKVVSTEDLSLNGVIVKGAPGEELASLPVRAAEELSGLDLMRKREADVMEVKKLVEERGHTFRLPRYAVIMSESHLGQQLPQSICETATAQFLLDVGLDAYACGTPESRQWAKSLRWETHEGGRDEPGPMRELPAETEGADLLIVGHGWSSPTPKHGSYGKLAICDSRVEVKVIDLATALEVGQGMSEGLSLGRTEEEAARKALERAGEQAAFYIGRYRAWLEQHPLSPEAQKATNDQAEKARSE